MYIYMYLPESSSTYSISIFKTIIIKGNHLDLDTWVVPGQFPTSRPPLGSGKQLQTGRYRGVDLSRSSHTIFSNYYTGIPKDVRD